MTRLEELDRISRTRALTKLESFQLEREIIRADGRRAPWGLVKGLVRQGIKPNGKAVPV
jgi:hypothetical protein